MGGFADPNELFGELEDFARSRIFLGVRLEAIGDEVPGHVAAIVRVVPSFKPKLGSVVNLWNTPGGEHEGECELEGVFGPGVVMVAVFEGTGEESGGKIVVIEEGHQLVVVGVGVILV